MTAEIKKNRYVYYHCTGHKGKCPEKYVREEELAAQFGEALGAIRLDEEVVKWVTKALKEGHRDEKKYHDDMISSLQRQYRKLQDRIDGMYLDKLDGVVTQDFYDKKSKEWREEQADIIRKIESHQGANESYLEEGVRILELSQRVVTLYDRQEMREKRRIVEIVFSNSIWKGGELHPNYRKPFDILAVTNSDYRHKKAVSKTENSNFDIWLPG